MSTLRIVIASLAVLFIGGALVSGIAEKEKKEPAVSDDEPPVTYPRVDREPTDIEGMPGCTLSRIRYSDWDGATIFVVRCEKCRTTSTTQGGKYPNPTVTIDCP